jgi:hypothetical protein
MQDIYNITQAAAVIPAAVVTASPDAVEVALDGSFDAAKFIINTGTTAETLSASLKIGVQVEASDDGGASYRVVRADEILGAEPNASGVVYELTDKAKVGIFEFGYAGAADKLKISVIVTGSMTTGVPLAVILEKGHLRLAPPDRS